MFLNDFEASEAPKPDEEAHEALEAPEEAPEAPGSSQSLQIHTESSPLPAYFLHFLHRRSIQNGSHNRIGANLEPAMASDKKYADPQTFRKYTRTDNMQKRRAAQLGAK